MLDQTAENTEPVEALVSEEETTATVFPFDADKAWEAVIAASPAMARLPDMVADQYDEHAYPDPKELKQVKEHTVDRVKTGITFVFEMLGDNINKLFENYDVLLGHSIEILWEDIEEVWEANDGVIENYAIEEACGRLFAYMAIEAYCRERSKDVDDGSEVDMMTGWFKNLEPLPILAYLEGVLNCVPMTASFRADVRAEATKVIHFQHFLLLDPDKKTVWH